MREITSGPIDSIRFEDVVAFCAEQRRENVRLDYKQQFSSDRPARQIAKVVASFANTSGGTILYGVQEAKSGLPVAQPTGMDLGNDPHATVVSACAHGVFPPVTPDVSDLLRNPGDDSKGFLAVRVPASDQIHTVEDGAGIYVRVGDHSEPIRATLQMIEHLQMRQRAATDFQVRRRSKALEQLKVIAGSEGDTPGALWLTIGPRVAVDPLFELRELRDRASQLSSESHYFGIRSPIDQSLTTTGLLDGLYSCDPTRDFAGILDVFGNVSLYANLACPQAFDRRYQLTVEQNTLEYPPPERGGKPLGLEGRLAVERILTTLRSAHRVYAATGFVGLLGGTLRVTNLRGLPLTICSPRWGARVLASSQVDNTTQLHFAPVTSDLGDGEALDRVVRTIVTRLLCAWGNLDDEACQWIIEEAEMAHFGQGECPKCKSYYRPSNRESCRHCRRTARGDDE